MIYRTDRSPSVTNNNEDIEFQVIDWYTLDTIPEISEDSNGSEPKNTKLQYKSDEYYYDIKAFGVLDDGQSISATITKYTPYFYVEVPDNWEKRDRIRFVDFLKSKVKQSFKETCIKHTFEYREKFIGFTNHKQFKFVRLVFNHSRGLQSWANVLSKKIRIPGLAPDKKYFPLYESNLDPLLRFGHIRDIGMAGWIKIPSKKYTVNNPPTTTCNVDIEARWSYVYKSDKSKISQIVQLLFDIEADSSHGDFPLAKKNYKKLGMDIVNLFSQDKIKIKFDSEDYFYFLLSSFYKTNTSNINSSNFESNVESNVESNLESNQSYIGLRTDKLENLSTKEQNYLDDFINIVYTKEKRLPDQDKIRKAANITQSVFKEYENNLEEYLKLTRVISYLHIILEEGLYSNTRRYKKNFDLFTKELLAHWNNVLENLKENPPPSNSEEKQEEHCVEKYCKKKILHHNLCSRHYAIKVSQDYISKIYDKKISSHIFNELNLVKLNYDIDVSKLINQSVSRFNRIKHHSKKKNLREKRIEYLTYLYDYYFPPLEGDKVIQIGSCIKVFGEKECALKHIITLDTCDPIPGTEVVQCKEEKDVLLEWTKLIQKLDPDVISGYNIFGFDFKYMYERAEELNIQDDFGLLSRFREEECKLEEKFLQSSGMGDNELSYVPMPGRVLFDLFKVVQNSYKLDSYKLDSVASYFMKGKVKNIEVDTITTDNLGKLIIGKFISLSIITSSSSEKIEVNDKSKFKILDIDIENKRLVLDTDFSEKNVFENIPKGAKIEWSENKDDVSPKDIFRLQKGNSTDRMIVAKYCVQDCELVVNLVDKLDVLTNNIGMANVCSVPLAYLFLRGQGIKIFSLSSKECRIENTLIEAKRRKENDDDENEEDMDEDEGGYEGAIVLYPHIGIYLEESIPVLDYASLYPSSMISENISHDSIILDSKYDNLPGYDYVNVSYDVYEMRPSKTGTLVKTKVGVNTCRYAQPPQGEKSIMPKILRKLLGARKATRAKIKEVDDPFQKSVLDGLQLAYKVTANSLYGQIGAPTSQIYFKDIAACTTATGRKLLYYAKDFTENIYKPEYKVPFMTNEGEKVYIQGGKCVYGDTDSIFTKFTITDKDNNHIRGKRGLEISIQIGVDLGVQISKGMKPPHDLEYEKTFWPFCLFSKKRYVGNLYETDPNSYSLKSMGIVLKRRDNAPVVKYVFGGIIDIILNEKDIEKSVLFCKEAVNKMFEGLLPMDMFIISKSLRSDYKAPETIAHKALADRMGERDPGNKPQVGDRIPFVYIEVKVKNKEKILQGDRIEHPQYIRENNIPIDKMIYLTNQIMKPVSQIYGLVVNKLKDFRMGEDYFDNLAKNRPEKYPEKKIIALRQDEAIKILFSDAMRKETNKRNNVKEITNWFSRVNK